MILCVFHHIYGQSYGQSCIIIQNGIAKDLPLAPSRGWPKNPTLSENPKKSVLNWKQYSVPLGADLFIIDSKIQTVRL